MRVMVKKQKRKPPKCDVEAKDLFSREDLATYNDPRFVSPKWKKNTVALAQLDESRQRVLPSTACLTEPIQRPTHHQTVSAPVDLSGQVTAIRKVLQPCRTSGTAIGKRRLSKAERKDLKQEAVVKKTQSKEMSSPYRAPLL